LIYIQVPFGDPDETLVLPAEDVSPIPLGSTPGDAVAPVRDINEFKTIASPLIWADWRRDTFISKVSIVPFAVDPRKTAGGIGSAPSTMEVAGTG
jgi:hypothetical protein